MKLKFHLKTAFLETYNSSHNIAIPKMKHTSTSTLKKNILNKPNFPKTKQAHIFNTLPKIPKLSNYKPT